MTALLILKEELEKIYGEYRFIVQLVVKACLTLVTLLAINQKIGYTGALQSFPLILLLSVACAFLHAGAITTVASLFVLANFASLSLEITAVAFLVLLIMLFLYVRLAPSQAILLVLVPLAFYMQIPYVAPLLIGLLLGPISAVGVGCGVVIYYFIEAICENVVTINGLGDADFIEKLRIAIDGVAQNDTMLVVALAFVVTTMTVYTIKGLSIDYAWMIAVIVGAVANLLFIMIGDFLYGAGINLLVAVLSSVVSVAIALVVIFFKFNVDYNRTEKVQFEDEEYCYYVKAVPKMNMPTQTRKVKRITTSARPAHRNHR
ncbi:MAG: hypothetical protein R3Y47_02545 [Lachnospiraceae bacterium]